MAIIGKDILESKALLEAGELVSIPTETVYGLAGNALNVEAVTKIFKVKDRPSFDPLIVHVSGAEEINKYVENIPDAARKLMDKFWPGPLTILLKKKNIIPDLVTSGLDTVGIRCPAHPLTLSLLKTLNFPLAAPSANPFGYVSPTTAQHVDEQLGKKINYILDGGPCEIGIESTIVGFENNMPVVYRMGGLRIEDIELTIGKVSIQTQSTSNPKAPGQLQSHYAPTKKVIIGDVEMLLKNYPKQNTGVLSFSKDLHLPHQIILSPTQNLEEAAQNLFKALRQFDKMPIDTIITEFVPDKGLGRAINDRLKRAAALQG
jgi:L-threonylcarbamoyladenylate synthase